MIRALASGLLLLLAACSDRAAPAADGPGARLEQAARAAGLVDDPADDDPAGVYASDSDRVCIAPAATGYRVGALVDYGPGQGCVATGRATGRGQLAIDFGDGCRVDATLAQGRLAFAATIPAACARRCTGRASLAALEADRLSTSTAEAAAFRTPRGGKPCG